MLSLQELTVHELKGTFPDVPIAASVDREALYAGDENPFHIVLPIAQRGRVSGNGLLYDEALVKSILDDAVGRGGIRGHIVESQRDTAFPVDEVHWVGVLEEGSTIWAKGYVPPGATREDIRRRKARGDKIATSIYGQYAEREPVKGMKAWRAKGFKLENIDLAPASRAALQLNADFQITTEMSQGETPVTMTLADVPAEIKQAIIQEFQATQQPGLETQVQTLSEQLQASHQTIAELKAAVQKAAEESFNGWLAELINTEIPDQTDELRPGALRVVRFGLKESIDREKAQTLLQEYLDSGEYKALAELSVKAKAGGPAYAGTRVTNGFKGVSEKSEDMTNARKEFGF